MLESRQIFISRLGVRAGMAASDHPGSCSVLPQFHRHVLLSFGMAILLLPGAGEGKRQTTFLLGVVQNLLFLTPSHIIG